MTREFPSARICFWLCVACGVMYYGTFAQEAVQKHDRGDLGLALIGLLMYQSVVCLLAWVETR